MNKLQQIKVVALAIDDLTTLKIFSYLRQHDANYSKIQRDLNMKNGHHYHALKKLMQAKLVYKVQHQISDHIDVKYTVYGITEYGKEMIAAIEKVNRRYFG